MLTDSPEPNSKRASLVFAARVNGLYERSVPAFFAVAANSAIVAYLMWPIAGAPMVGAWLAAIWLVLLLRLVLNSIYRRRRGELDEAQSWARWFCAGAALHGVCWGFAGGALYPSGYPLEQVLLAFVIAGMVAGATVSTSSYLPAFFAFSIPALVPIVGRTLATGGDIHVAMAVMCLVFVTGVAAVAHRGGRLFNETITLKQENDQLAISLVAAHDRLRHAQRVEAIGRLAGGVAHNFNNILMGIDGCAQVVGRNLPRDHDSKVFLDEIHTATARGAALTKQLLAFGIQTDEDVGPTEMGGVLDSVKLVLGELLGSAIQLEVVCHERPQYVSAGAGEVEQAIMNLALNSRDAMPRGGRLLIETRLEQVDRNHEVWKSGMEPGLFLVVSVSDTGCGMDAQTVERMFEPFFTTKRDTGTGLGLYTLYGMLSSIGGQVWVESVVGEGTTISMYFPSAEDPAKDLGSARDQRTARGHECILLVEDDRLVRATVRSRLEELGYRVLEAQDASDALRLWAHPPEPISLLVTDVALPGQSGTELVQEIRSRQKRVTPVLFMSAHSEESIKAGESTQEKSMFLQKPFAQEVLAARVRQLLD